MNGRIVVLIGSDEIQHRYVARSLAKMPNSAIIIAEQPQLSVRERTARASKRFGFLVLISRVLLKVALRVFGATERRQKDLARVLGNPEFPKDVPLFRTGGVNSAETQKLLRELRPDVLCVYGTYIVSNATLSICPIALNLHTGISPRYRGADCYFWPLYNSEPDWIGATVHKCTSKVDGGEIFATARAALEPTDGLGAVFGRSVMAGAEIYKNTAEDLLAGRSITPQSQELSAGAEYIAKMRGWRAELRVAWLVRRGLIRDYAKSAQCSADHFSDSAQAGLTSAATD